MRDPDDPLVGARLLDLLRPGRLFVGLAFRPTFVLPTLILVAATVLYSQLAVGPSLPRVVPELVESSLDTESELARAFRWLILSLSLLLPMVFVGLTAFACWLLLLVFRSRMPFISTLSLVAHASLWAALGFVAKASLVLVTGDPEPSVNLSLLLSSPPLVLRVILAFTNPFLLLALAWTVRGLRVFGAGPRAAGLAGSSPWVAWILFFVLGAGGGTTLAPSGPVSYEGWKTIEQPHVVVRHAPGLQTEGREVATLLQEFTERLAERYDFEPRPLRVHLFADHAELERATGEFLHVKVTGSIRGRDLLFLEMPGRSAVLTKERGLRDAIRYVALMHLPLSPGVEGSPRWFVEGLAHAAVEPWSDGLEAEYRLLLRRVGVPPFETLMDPSVFRTPDGPLLARSVLDHIVFHHGREVLDAIAADIRAGSTFRDALFSHTRLTTSALESGWQESIRKILREEEGRPPPVPEPRPGEPDTTGTDVAPFLPRN